MAAASFLGMWVVMMVAMMLPCLVKCCGDTARRSAGEARRASVG
jgi:predicted metal-binding membrane protein